MYYVAAFDSDPTKSFTNVAFNNLKALQTQKLNFELRPLNFVLNWNNAPSWFTEEDRDYFTTTRTPQKPAALVHLQISDLLKVPYKSPTDAVGYTAFEATLVPRWICEGLNVSYRGLIVPSQHCADVLRECGLTIPVKAVPHALPKMWLKDLPTLEDKPSNTFVFGSVGYWNTRKNMAGVLEAYIEAFPNPSSDTALLLKTYNAGDLESRIGNRPDIWVYDEQWSEQQMLWAYGMIDCYVSPTRGEAFGLAVAQAAALGKPCIYTDFSAPTEWLNSERHYPLEYEFVKVSETMTSRDHPFEHIDGPNIRWADVDSAHLADTLRRVAAERPVAGFKGSDLAEFRSSLSWESVGEKLVGAMEDILDRELERIP